MRCCKLIHIFINLCPSLLKIYSASTMGATPEFLQTNIRVKPDLDALGALGDLAWYCIGAALWAKGYELPTAVQALPDTTRNSAGVILSCTAFLHWGAATTATIHCSFLSHTSMDLAITSSNASIRTNDFIIPYGEDCAQFELTRGAKFLDLYTGWSPGPEEVEVNAQLSQEALMVEELARLARGIREFGHRPDGKWPEISRKTQLVLDAVKRSIDLGCETVQL